jgi:hypothetical protein
MTATNHLRARHPRAKLFRALPLCLAALVLATVQLGGAPAARAQDYAAILAASDRSDADRQNDKRREAFKLLTFIGPKTGWMVLDMGADAGYSTELLARTVGPGGKVWGQNDKTNEKFEARRGSPSMGNAVSWIHPYNEPAEGLPPLDLITFLFAYHDTTYMDVDRAKMNKALFAALKPGGILGSPTIRRGRKTRPRSASSITVSPRRPCGPRSRPPASASSSRATSCAIPTIRAPRSSSARRSRSTSSC